MESPSHITDTENNHDVGARNYVFGAVTETETGVYDVQMQPADPDAPVISEEVEKLVLSQARNTRERNWLRSTIRAVKAKAAGSR
jgi:hypothetical protein